MSKVILTEVKKLLGILPEYHEFDDELVLNINMALNTLTQLGVGPERGFEITASGNETLEDFIAGTEGGTEIPLLHNSVLNYLYLRTKIIFDPPQGGGVLDVYKTQIEELAWRLNVQVDSIRTFTS